MKNVTGNRIEELRLSRGLSKQALSEILEMKSYTSITGWEKGDNLPRGTEVIKMAKYFNVSTDYIYGLDDVKKRS